MADIKDYTKQIGSFLKAEHVAPDKKFVIADEATIEHNEKFNKDDLHVPLKSGEEEYTFNCSKTNARTIKDVLGENTNGWIGASLVFETYKTKTSEGKMVDALNVKEVVKKV